MRQTCITTATRHQPGYPLPTALLLTLLLNTFLVAADTHATTPSVLDQLLRAEQQMLAQAKPLRQVTEVAKAGLMLEQTLFAFSSTIACQPQRVLLVGTALSVPAKPTDPIEHLGCLADGKLHESLVKFPGETMRQLAYAIEGTFGTALGAPPVMETDRYLPPRGLPISVMAMWQHPTKPDMYLRAPASGLFRDSKTTQVLGASFVYAARLADDKDHLRQLRTTRACTTALSVYHDVDALIWSARPAACIDDSCAIDTAITPAAQTKVLFEVQAQRPDLLLVPLAGPQWRLGTELLTQAALAQRIAQINARDASPLAAAAITIGIEVPDADRSNDVAWLLAVLEAGQQAHAQVAPVLIPAACVPLLPPPARHPRRPGPAIPAAPRPRIFSAYPCLADKTLLA